jgi:hypothetical protein
MVTFIMAKEVPDAPSKLVVLMQNVEEKVAKRFENVFEVSPKTRVGVIGYSDFMQLLEDLNVARPYFAGERKGPLCTNCRLVYTAVARTKCVVCGQPLRPPSGRRRTKTREKAWGYEPFVPEKVGKDRDVTGVADVGQ